MEQKTETEAERLQQYRQKQADKSTKAIKYLMKCQGMSRAKAVSTLFRIKNG